VETLDALRERFGPGADLHFAMGSDQFAEIETWKDWGRIFELAHVVVVARPQEDPGASGRALPVESRESFCYDPLADSFRHASGMNVFFRDAGALPISSTGIRALVRAGRSIRYLVPEGVRELITRHGLYRGPEPGAG
jgi:nicotinate-nucleotide adenylyltransferase